VGGNAGSECYVFGAVAGTNAACWSREHSSGLGARAVNTAEKLARGLSVNRRGHALESAPMEIRRLMAAYAGVVREESELDLAAMELERIERAAVALKVASLPDLVARAEIQSMVLTGLLVVMAARQRKESRGVHFRIDFPRRDDAGWRRTIGFVKRRDRISLVAQAQGSEAA